MTRLISSLVFYQLGNGSCETGQNDLFSIGFWVLIVLILRFICSQILTPFIVKNFAKRQSPKFEETFFLSIHYILAFFFGYLVLHDKYWFRLLYMAWKDRKGLWDYDGDPFPCDVKNYYAFQLGFYIVDLPFAFFKQKQPYLILAHHITTITLVGASFYYIHYQIGTLLMILHDISDVFLYVAQAFNYLGYPALQTACFVPFVLSFFFFRLIILPFLNYSTLIEYKGRTGFVGDVLTGGLPMLGLIFMHIYWFYLILKVIYRTFTTDKGVADVRSDDEDDEVKDDKKNNDKNTPPVQTVKPKEENSDIKKRK
ncbi:ceramide synthase 1 [Anaeramoeba ignava]|uniref:Ceramide synthase 1 n=1 Tax=Anaeramoeba ignava TaxID=1746090 RepID=A0A9Q0LIC0_ANAIG|nr:ceramide synthase 1 [Anaeramoeba ignava]